MGIGEGAGIFQPIVERTIKSYVDAPDQRDLHREIVPRGPAHRPQQAGMT